MIYKETIKSTYQQLIQNPPKLNLPGKEETKSIKEVVFDLCSCMCDNRYRFTFKKNEAGEFRLLRHGFAYSNFQIKGYRSDDLEWLADDGEWSEVVSAINSGVQKVEKTKYR
jgi:hypothetical protein